MSRRIDHLDERSCDDGDGDDERRRRWWRGAGGERGIRRREQQEPRDTRESVSWDLRDWRLNSPGDRWRRILPVAICSAGGSDGRGAGGVSGGDAGRTGCVWMIR